MTLPVNASHTSEEADVRTTPELPDGVAETDTYETEEGVVFYDVNDPLAWVQTDTTLAVAEMT